MGITTYSGIVSAVVEVMEDDSEEFVNYIPTAIEIAERRLLRESDGLFLVTNSNLTGVSGQRLLAKPDRYQVGFTLSFTTSDGLSQVLRKQTRSWCERYWRYAETSVGQPKYYADYNNGNWLVVPTPDSSYGYSAAFLQRPVGISAGNPTNVFTANIPDCLFYATVTEMARYARNDLLLQTYDAQYASAMVAANNLDRRSRRDEGMMPMNGNVQVNTLKQDN